MKIKHALLTSILPVVAFATTSCNGVANKINFKQAVEYASNHFDKYALDAVSATDVLKINSVSIAGAVDVTNMESGVKHKYDVNAGVKGLTFNIPNVSAIPFTSTIVSYIGSAYNDFAALLATVVDTNPTSLDYYTNNGGLLLYLSNISKIKPIDNYKMINSMMNADPYAIPKLLGVPNDPDESTYPEYTPDYYAWREYVTLCISGIFGQMIGAVIADTLDSMLIKPFTNIIDELSSLYSVFNVGIDATSTSRNDTFYISSNTNNKGFLTEASFVFKTDLDILASAVAKEWMGMSYVADASLSIDVNISFKSYVK